MWMILERDTVGLTLRYWYDTRKAARAHLARVRNNPFLKGWMVEGINPATGASV